MCKLLLVATLAFACSCVDPTPELDSEASVRTQVDKPNIRVSVRGIKGVDNVNIKHGRRSFLNYSFGTNERRTVAVKVSDKTYEEFRDASFAILRHPTNVIDGENVIAINLPLFEDDIAAHSLSTNACTFTYHPGQSAQADKLYELTIGLLDKHREE